jgi:hypothetical protein
MQTHPGEIGNEDAIEIRPFSTSCPTSARSRDGLLLGSTLTALPLPLPGFRVEHNLRTLTESRREREGRRAERGYVRRVGRSGSGEGWKAQRRGGLGWVGRSRWLLLLELVELLLEEETLLELSVRLSCLGGGGMAGERLVGRSVKLNGRALLELEKLLLKEMLLMLLIGRKERVKGGLRGLLIGREGA